MVTKHVNKKNAGKPRVLVIILFYTHLLLLLQPSVLWLSIVTFNNDARPPSKWILREFDVSRIRPRVGRYPTLKRLHGKIWPRLRGLPGLADRATRLSGSSHLSCKRDQIWSSGLPHLSGLPDLHGVPHLHVNRPLVHLKTKMAARKST